MPRPLYQVPAGREPRRELHGHAGLWFDKFCDRWQSGWKMEAPEKLEWIRKTAGQVGNPDQIRESARRLMRLTRMLNGRAQVYATESRFVTGLGRSHPVENGFAWHPTLGTPFLPGSSVKGMIKAWAKAEQEDERQLKRILGSLGQVGSVRFLDAVPMAPVSLEADVMTPHYAGWSRQKPPGDWCSPTPIPFLTTAPGTQFVFGIVPTSATQDGDLDIVSGWLDNALKWAGAGAKTAVGYGRMKRDEEQERDAVSECEKQEAEARNKRERVARQAKMSPIEREIEQAFDERIDKNMTRGIAAYQAIEAGRWEGDDKRSVAEWLRDEWKKEKRWRKESKKPRKDKDHQRTLRVIEWLGE